MKTHLLFLCSFLLLGLYSCKQDDIVLNKEQKMGESLSFPKGTSIKINEAGNSLDFKLPEGYAIIGEKKNGELSRFADGGTLTCACSSPSNGGCSPFVASGPKGEITGCSMNNCTSCTGTVSSGKGINEEEMMVNKINLIKISEPITFITDLSEYEKLKSPTEKIMSSPFFRKELAEFVRGYQSKNLSSLKQINDINNLKDIDYLLVPVNFYGYKVYIPVDKTLNLAVANPAINKIMARFAEGGGYSCSCNTNEGGCKLSKSGIPMLGGAVWCEAGTCGSCSLSN